MDEIDLNVEKYKEFVRNRITELRLKTNLSEYQVSYALGQNKGYIFSISSGKALPSMAGFFNICDYFGITPAEFFDTSVKEPDLVHKVTDEVKTLSKDDLELIYNIALRLKSDKDEI